MIILGKVIFLKKKFWMKEMEIIRKIFIKEILIEIGIIQMK